MSNFKKHAQMGAIVGGATGFFVNFFQQLDKIDNNKEEKFNFFELLGYTTGGVAIGTIGGVLPDLLEPAKDPNHRKFFHSITTGIVVGTSVVALNKSNLPKEVKAIASVAAAGYLSHLALDSATPKGLPLV